MTDSTRTSSAPAAPSPPMTLSTPAQLKGLTMPWPADTSDPDPEILRVGPSDALAGRSAAGEGLGGQPAGGA